MWSSDIMILFPILLLDSLPLHNKLQVFNILQTSINFQHLRIQINRIRYQWYPLDKMIAIFICLNFSRALKVRARHRVWTCRDGLRTSQKIRRKRRIVWCFSQRWATSQLQITRITAIWFPYRLWSAVVWMVCKNSINSILNNAYWQTQSSTCSMRRSAGGRSFRKWWEAWKMRSTRNTSVWRFIWY